MNAYQCPSRQCPVACAGCDRPSGASSLDVICEIRNRDHGTRLAPVTTVQADRDAGQVRLTEDDEYALTRALGMCTFREDPDDGSMCMCGLPALGHAETVGRMMRRDFPAVFTVIDRLAARQSDPDATEREALAKAWDRGYTSGHSNAMRRMSDEPNAPTTPNPYRRTVTTGEWTEVGK